MAAAATDRVLTLDTTEMRWFASGALPAEVIAWFTAEGTAAVLEDRRDSYRVGETADRGVKRRFQDVLELKHRLAVGRPIMLAPGLAAATEQWRRWSPADDRVVVRASDAWIDVHKVVYKRRFTGDGREIPWVSHPPSDVQSGCDVEVSEVSIETRTDWSFSLAAFGPARTRRATLRLGWDALLRLGPPPEGFAEALRRPVGYPQWLLDELRASDRDLLV